MSDFFVRTLPQSPNLLGFLAILFWSTGAATISTLESIPRYQFNAMACTLILVGTLVKLAISKNWKSLAAPWQVWAIVILGVPIPQIFYVFAYQSCPPAEVDILVYLWPIMTLGLTGIFLDKKLGARHFLAGFLGFSAVVLLSMKNGQGIGTLSAGHLVAIGCAILWSLYTVSIKRFSGINSNIMGVCYGVCLLVSITLHLCTETFVVPNLFEVSRVGYYALFVATLPFILWAKSIDQGNYVLLTTTSYVKPLLSILFLITLGLAEFSVHLSIACALVIGAGLLANDQIAQYIQEYKNQMSFPSLFLKAEEVESI